MLLQTRWSCQSWSSKRIPHLSKTRQLLSYLPKKKKTRQRQPHFRMQITQDWKGGFLDTVEIECRKITIHQSQNSQNINLFPALIDYIWVDHHYPWSNASFGNKTILDIPSLRKDNIDGSSNLLLHLFHWPLQKSANTYWKISENKSPIQHGWIVATLWEWPISNKMWRQWQYIDEKRENALKKKKHKFDLPHFHVFFIYLQSWEIWFLERPQLHIVLKRWIHLFALERIEYKIISHKGWLYRNEKKKTTALKSI